MIAQPALFLFGISYASFYSAPNAITVDSAAVMIAESFSFNNATVPLLAILTIVHLSGVFKYYTVTGVF